MTRTELIAQANDSTRIVRGWEQLGHCQAWTARAYIGNVRHVTLLRSYETIVAVYSERTGTVYEFGRYSSTTTQHVYKFARATSAMRITHLYKPNNCIIEQAINPYANTFKLSRSEWETCFDLDFSCEIENF